MKTSQSAANGCGAKSPLDWQRDFPSKHFVRSVAAACSALLASAPALAQSWTLTGASVDFEWQSLACSADGSILTAAAYDDGFGDGGPVDVSTNFGATWTQTGAPTNLAWQSVASSTNGTKLVAAVYQNADNSPGPIYASIDAGLTWKAPAAPADFWIGVAASSDGARMVAADSGSGDGLIYTSTNFGKSWTATSAPSDFWASIASSADGTKLVAADSGYGDGLIYSSTNSGLAWTATTAPVGYWTSVSSSADGSKVAAASYPGGIYTWQSIPALSIMLSSGNLLISWQASSSTASFVLQEDSDLAMTNWVTVTNLPAQTNGLNRVVIPLPLSGNQFYRLTSP